jgi:hypothetical protein
MNRAGLSARWPRLYRSEQEIRQRDAAERCGIEEHTSLEEACLALGLNYKTVVCWPSSRDPRRLAKWQALRAWRNPSRKWRVPISAIVAIQAKATTGLGMARKNRRSA